MKTFKDLREATGSIVKNIIDPNTLRDIRTLTMTLTSNAQSTIPDVLEKLETRLNFSGYTLGELDLDGIEDSGSEDYFIIGKADNEIVRNAFLTLEWDTMDSPAPVVSTRADGGKLRLDVLVSLNELPPEEMDVIIANSLSNSVGEDGEELIPNDGEREPEVEPDDTMNEEVLLEAALRVKKLGRTLTATIGTDTVITMVVEPSGAVNLCGIEIPKQHAETVINALVEHYIEKTEK